MLLLVVFIMIQTSLYLGLMMRKLESQKLSVKNHSNIALILIAHLISFFIYLI